MGRSLAQGVSYSGFGFPIKTLIRRRSKRCQRPFSSPSLNNRRSEQFCSEQFQQEQTFTAPNLLLFSSVVPDFRLIYWWISSDSVDSALSSCSGNFISRLVRQISEFFTSSVFHHMPGAGIHPSPQQRPPVHAHIPSAAAPSPPSHPSNHDEVRTIFIMGLPEDVKERELHNLLRWLPVAAKDALQKMVFDAKLKSLLHIEMARKNFVVKRGLVTDSDAFDKNGRFPVPPVLPLPNSASVGSPNTQVPVKTGCCVKKSAVDGVHEGIEESTTKGCSNDKSGCYTLFIENLPEKIHWKRFESLFCSHGRVLDAFIPNKRNSKGVRFGFISFASIEEARRAISKMNGYHIDGSKIGVSFAKFKPRHSYWKKSSTGVLLGWCKEFIKIGHLARQMHAKGLTGFSLMRTAGNAVLMIFENSSSLRSVNNDKSKTLAEWFSIVEAWSKSLNIADCWGQLLAIYESCQSPSSFDRAKIKVLAKAGARIDAMLELKVGDNSFKIMVHEIESSFKPNSWTPEEDESH
ncbi:receptor-like protein kinase-like [Hibiscus syriacus]|uniref:Receptor-like protein kinase-like n=1 Tax=Hibiscus syriacus TaxID=106335 RepID=A0A6A2ZV48_HIBSY|nr:receptor-like protein kinase-like [Hibiscus syriacus]